LNFLCQTIHPSIRNDSSEISSLLNIYNGNLSQDGYKIIEKAKISGQPVFAGVKSEISWQNFNSRITEIKDYLTADYVMKQITLMESSIDSAPHVSIGIAKELIETCCISILKEKGIESDKNWDMIHLMKETAKLLNLTPDNIADTAKGSKIIKSILGSLSTIVQGMSELRNEYGGGHGKDANFKGLQPRHARLAVGSASSLAVFMLETHEFRK
jgi:hypothetical protein